MRRRRRGEEREREEKKSKENFGWNLISKIFNQFTKTYIRPSIPFKTTPHYQYQEIKVNIFVIFLLLLFLFGLIIVCGNSKFLDTLNPI